MKQSPSFEANSSSTIQEFPEIKGPGGSLTHSQQPATLPFRASTNHTEGHCYKIQ